jgi:hypothetical protein
LGKCQRKEVAEDAAKEGKGVLAWFSAATAAPKYHEIKQKERPNTHLWLTLEILKTSGLREPILAGQK